MTPVEIEVAQAIITALVKLADLARGLDSGTIDPKAVLAQLATFASSEAAEDAKVDAEEEAKFGKLEPPKAP